MNNVYDTRKWFWILMLSIFCVSAFAADDQLPPKIDKTDPSDGLLDVFPNLYVHCWLSDPVAPGNEIASGVDPHSVSVWVNDEQILLTVQMIGNDRVWAHSRDMLALPECSWVNVTVAAKDLAGNAMAPYSFHFLTSRLPDTSAPVFSHHYPAHNSTQNGTSTLISCRILDNDSGVDLESIAFSVDSDTVNFTYAILPDGLELFHVPSTSFPYDSWVNVTVFASDYSGNDAQSSWTFKTEPEPYAPPRLYHPVNNTLLNYQWEAGKIRFVWETIDVNHCYRIRIKPEGSLVTDIIDLSPLDFWSTGSLAGHVHHVTFDQWFSFSCYDYVEWSIAIIDQATGDLLSPFSPWSSFILAPPNAVVIRSPANDSVFNAFDSSPTFSWDPFLGAQYYLFGVAKYNASTGTFQNVIVLNVESEVSSLHLPLHTWKSMGPGLFIWGVIAVDQRGNYSDFMNYHFTRLAPVVITQPLTLN